MHERNPLLEWKIRRAESLRENALKIIESGENIETAQFMLDAANRLVNPDEVTNIAKKSYEVFKRQTPQNLPNPFPKE